GNPDGAKAFIEFMLDADFQQTLPDEMYMYPVRDDVEIPEDWEQYAPLSEDAITVDLDEVAQNRDNWLDDWTQLYENTDACMTALERVSPCRSSWGLSPYSVLGQSVPCCYGASLTQPEPRTAR